jgi:hypothetical protein
VKILSEVETSAWIDASLGYEPTSEALNGKFACQTVYLLPVDTGRKTALARSLANFIDLTRSGLLWITSSGVWPSNENMDLFDGYRRSLGEQRPLRDSPGHVFQEPDVSALQTFLGLSLYFFWDAVLIEGTQDLAIRFSHDEYVEIYAKSGERLSTIDGLLSKMEMKRVDTKP